MTRIKHFIATKAFLKRDGKILLLRESNQYHDGVNVGRYDLPGGRIDPGEELLSALKREVQEECSLSFISPKPFFENTLQLQKNEEIWEIRRIYYACDANCGQVVLSTDHNDYQWIDPEKYSETNIIPDLAGVFDAYLLSYKTL